MTRYAMIMAGGAGTRLWPMSRQARPKQLLPLFGGKSLLELACDRLTGAVAPEHRLICTAERFRDLIREAIPSLADEQVLGEPVGRDTINAVGLTAAVLAARDADAVFAVLTADHVIDPDEEFRARLAVGFDLVEENPARFVTFGITPTEPATGYGYVRRGAALPGRDDAFESLAFVEKPVLEVAQSYLASGDYAWNSGMFVFHAGTVMDALRRHAPENAAGLEEIAAAWGTPQQAEVLARVYATLPKTSVDYGLMEPAATDDALDICVVPMDIDWVDVGSWPSFAEKVDADDDGNRVVGKAINEQSSNVLVVNDNADHLVTTFGCEDLVVIHTADATLVCPRDRAPDIKALVERVPGELR